MFKAAKYMLNEWDGIEAITTGGDYSWDNNLIERINRYISLSRRIPFSSAAMPEQSVAASSTLSHVHAGCTR